MLLASLALLGLFNAAWAAEQGLLLAEEAPPTAAEEKKHLDANAEHQSLVKAHGKASALVKELTHKASLAGVSLPDEPNSVKYNAIQMEMDTKERKVKRKKRYPKPSGKETMVKRVYEIMEKTSAR